MTRLSHKDLALQLADILCPEELHMELYDYDRRAREHWVKCKAKSVLAGSRVLDVGAGTCLYGQYFSHCDYKTQDLKEYKGKLRLGATSYGKIDYQSDITSIPVPDGSFDVVLCTDVLEHVPEPIEAIREMSRILRLGGRFIITAPLLTGLHQTPYHYYGGYTPQWFKHFFPKFGLEVTEFVMNGGLLRILSQDCVRAALLLKENKHLLGDRASFILHVLGGLIPSFLFEMDQECFSDQFTDGYFIEAQKVK